MSTTVHMRPPPLMLTVTTVALVVAQVLLMRAEWTESFQPSSSAILRHPVRSTSPSSQLSMVLEKPATQKTLAKIEQLKIDSDHLVHPLQEVRFVSFTAADLLCVCRAIHIVCHRIVPQTSSYCISTHTHTHETPKR